MKVILDSFGNPKYVTQEGLMIIDGTTAKPVPLSFMFNNFWITLQPEEFLSDVSNAGDGSALLVMIIQN